MEMKFFLYAIFFAGVIDCYSGEHRLLLLNGTSGAEEIFTPFDESDGLRLQLAVLEQQLRAKSVMLALEEVVDGQKSSGKEDDEIQKIISKVALLREEINKRDQNSTQAVLKNLSSVRGRHVSQLRDWWHARWAFSKNEERIQLIADRILHNGDSRSPE